MIFILLFLVLLFSFVLNTIVAILYAVWLWQIKEYRFDRLLVHLRETKEGRQFLFNRNTIFLLVLFLLSPLSVLDFFKGWYLFFAALVFALHVRDNIINIQNKALRRPIFSLKATLLTSFGLLSVGILLVFSVFDWVATLVFIEALLFLIVSLGVYLLSIPTTLAKLMFFGLAAKKITQMRHLTVIGITGSYGKSSTKELIADFLSEKYNVLKTPGSVNTEIGIARFILQKLKKEHQVFVVEIGAYKRGEIASVCKMVSPTIGVLTGINEQHLSLFGNIENTKKAKFELIESLPEDGMAFFNGDDPTTVTMSKWSKVKSTYVYAQKQLPTGIKTQSKHTPFLSNLAAAYLVAQKLGVDQALLKNKVVKALDALGIKVIKHGDITILNDSFNSNPKGFHAGLDVLATYKGRKVLITPGIIELGGETKRIHRELGELIGTICDVVILTNDNFAEPIAEGLGKTTFDTSNTLILKRENIVAIVKNQIQDKTTVLLEGRMPAEVKQLFNKLTY